MSIYLGTTKKILPYSKIYLGNVLKFKKGPNYSDTEFTTCPFPTTWTQVTEGIEYTSTNNYGLWRIWAENYYDAWRAINYAFDGNLDTKNYYQAKRDSYIGIDLPIKVKIKPTNIKVRYNDLNTVNFEGLNENGEWENLTQITASNSNVIKTFSITTDKFYSKFRCGLEKYPSSIWDTHIYEFQITSGTIRIEN